MEKYRMVQGIGLYWNRRWEIQKRYTYYERKHGELKEIIGWHMVFWSSNKERCEEVFRRYRDEEDE